MFGMANAMFIWAISADGHSGPLADLFRVLELRPQPIGVPSTNGKIHAECGLYSLHVTVDQWDQQYAGDGRRRSEIDRSEK